jgi:hypothetical protein
MYLEGATDLLQIYMNPNIFMYGFFVFMNLNDQQSIIDFIIERYKEAYEMKS